MSSTSSLAQLYKDWGGINSRINALKLPDADPNQIPQLSKDVSAFTQKMESVHFPTPAAKYTLINDIKRFRTAIIQSTQELGKIVPIENEFQTYCFSFPEEQSWKEKINSLKSRINDLKKGCRSQLNRLEVFQKHLHAVSDYKKAGVGIEDSAYLNPFFKFYQLCCKGDARPEEITVAFQVLPEEERKSMIQLGMGKWFSDSGAFKEENRRTDFVHWLNTSYLVHKVNNLEHSDRLNLHGLVYVLAKADGVIIQGWDLEWGKNHLFNRPSRLVRALNQLEAKTISNRLQEIYAELQKDFGSRIAYQLVQNCPLLLSFKKGSSKEFSTEQLLAELKKRAGCIWYLQQSWSQLTRKNPLLLQNGHAARSSAWKGQERFFLAIPVFLDQKHIQRFEFFTSIVDELLSGSYDETTVGIILDRLLMRESFHPQLSDLTDQLRLIKINGMVQEQINCRSLDRAVESFNRDVFVVPSSLDKQGKFKPIPNPNARNEAYGSRCDRVFGFGMTAPTRLLGPRHFSQRVQAVQKGSLSAIEMLNDPEVPNKVKGSIFHEMYLLLGEGREIDRLGELIFCDKEGFHSSEQEKLLAIQNYLNSEAFRDHVSAFGLQGSLQLWLHHCSRAFDLIVKDPDGGRKLKTAPKTLTHLYVLLNMIKGSMDCSSGNTFVEFDAHLNRIVNFWDIDDERSMPTTHNFPDLRMWQMGLPQCTEPFDRAVLLLFSDPALLKKLDHHQFSLIPQEADKTQRERLTRIVTFFKKELLKEKISLTPRDLFFNLFGGREDFESVKRNGESDIELFEFHLPVMGRGLWYTSDENEKITVGKNMKALYSSRT